MGYIAIFDTYCRITVACMCAIVMIFIIVAFATIMFEILPDKLQEIQERRDLKIKMEKNRHENNI